MIGDLYTGADGFRVRVTDGGGGAATLVDIATFHEGAHRVRGGRPTGEEAIFPASGLADGGVEPAPAGEAKSDVDAPQQEGRLEQMQPDAGRGWSLALDGIQGIEPARPGSAHPDDAVVLRSVDDLLAAQGEAARIAMVFNQFMNTQAPVEALGHAALFDTATHDGALAAMPVQLLLEALGDSANGVFPMKEWS